MMLNTAKRVLKAQLLGSVLMMVGLLAAAPSKATASLGVYQGNGCDGLTALAGFTSWFGRQPDFVLDFFAVDSWTSMMNDANWTVGCWNRQGKTVVFSVPMLPNDGSTLAQGASGQFDDKFRALAKLLVSKGHGASIIRLGWEFNGGWYPWAAKKDPTSWVKYWQRIVTVMRAEPGSSFRFDWCSAQGYLQIPASTVYPGDAYVDIIGRDNYNQTWVTGVDTPAKRWTNLLTEQYGMNWLKDFATQHNKPMSFPEWGTGTRPDGHGGGDDPYFITQMSLWIKANNVEYHGYWDFSAKDFDAKLSSGIQPLAAAAFLAAFRSIPKAPTGVIAQVVN